MTQAEHIIAKFGTQQKLADAIGTKQNVVSAWKRRGFVPAPQQPKILAAAAHLGIELSPSDFFPDHSEAAA